MLDHTTFVALAHASTSSGAERFVRNELLKVRPAKIIHGTEEWVDKCTQKIATSCSPTGLCASEIAFHKARRYLLYTLLPVSRF